MSLLGEDLAHEKSVDIYVYICRLMDMISIRLSPQTLQVLDRFAMEPASWLYGYELSRETGLKSGTLYPILMRLAKHELLETRWVQTEEGVPPRHTYRLTSKGIELVKSDQLRARKPLAT
ncbi:MAG TPA: PadR family transcriptional regulator, partial [Terriglobia bacterium]|nr:PadR family transcriptional regulator [Terriglobia bacterium]